MRIAIDARWIFPEISGIGVYTRELIKHLALLDRDNPYILLFDNASVRDRSIAEMNLTNSPNFAAQLLPCGVFSLRNQMLLPGILKKNGIDVFHAPNYMIPLAAFPRHRAGKIKCVATIHDVIPMIFPHGAPRSKKARLYPIYRRIMIEVGARADAIITDSRASRSDVIRHLCIPASSANKVKAIYCGVSERFRQPKEPREAGGKRKEAGNILYVGRADPYKNLTTLIEAFARARKRCPFPVTLTIAGSLDPRYPEARRLVEEFGIAGAVNWTGYLSDDELVSTYQRADLLVHPSWYEGFGLQILEAMACGTPVVCSNAGSLPEVAGDAAIMIDPDDACAFAEKIEEVLGNNPMASEMSRKGIKQASKFTWERNAAETLALYEEIAGRKQQKT